MTSPSHELKPPTIPVSRSSSGCFYRGELVEVEVEAVPQPLDSARRWRPPCPTWPGYGSRGRGGAVSEQEPEGDVAWAQEFLRRARRLTRQDSRLERIRKRVGQVSRAVDAGELTAEQAVEASRSGSGDGRAATTSAEDEPRRGGDGGRVAAPGVQLPSVGRSGNPLLLGNPLRSRPCQAEPSPRPGAPPRVPRDMVPEPCGRTYVG